ncbi:MAG: sigma-54-dependent Fis family transcriptional regulator [Krumholzibacteria bacterium]|nr:sigma-54-dependent Fis family transcriptional regulator [Candidatus Krumholzibacteria bacterium]
MPSVAKPRLLLVDDDPDFAIDLAAFLCGRFAVQVLADGNAALAALAADRPDAVLLDIDLGSAPDGFAVLEAMQVRDDAPPVIMLTGAHRQNIDAVVRAIKAGAYHYVAKPPNIAELVNLLDKALADDELRRRLADLHEELADLRGEMVVTDPVSQRLLQDIARVAHVDGSVLITGESGTGKELVARRLHALSGRASGPFQDINCPAITDTLIESELFGHVRGAYTGAVGNRQGKLARADGGTLFLDEIGSCSEAFQTRLLRVLEERSFEPVGGDRKVVVDIRVVAATRIDLQRAIAAGRFREDLFYRLAGFQLHIPPLRERPADIMAQAAVFLHRAALGQAKSIGGFSDGARALLEGYAWPGNSRELRNTVERAVVFCDGDVIRIGDLQVGHAQSATLVGPYHGAKERVVEDFKRRYVPAQLKAAGGDPQRAAELSGLPVQTFRKFMREIGLNGQQDGRGGGAGT